MDEKLEKLNELKKVQGTHGNWDYCSYMHGLYNGIELAIAILEGREPDFKDAPDKWISGD